MRLGICDVQNLLLSGPDIWNLCCLLLMMIKIKVCIIHSVLFIILPYI